MGLVKHSSKELERSLSTAGRLVRKADLGFSPSSSSLSSSTSPFSSPSSSTSPSSSASVPTKGRLIRAGGTVEPPPRSFTLGEPAPQGENDFEIAQAKTRGKYERQSADASEAEKGLSVQPGFRDVSDMGTDAWRALSAIQKQKSPIGLEEVQTMTEKERQTFLSLAGAQDWKGLREYYAALQRDLNARYQEKRDKEVSQWAQEHPILGSAANVVTSFLSPLAYLSNAGQAIQNFATGEKVPTDPNSLLTRGAHLADATAQGVHATAQEAAGPVGGFLADTALSAANMGARLWTGGWALPLLGLSAAGENTLDTLQRGASPSQALTTSTAAGAAEILTEALPVDQLFRLSKAAPASAREAVKNVLKTMGSEATQEAVTEAANNLVDQAVMGDLSEYETYVRQLMAQGIREEEARKRASLQFYGANVALAGVGGALLGGVLSGGAQAVGYHNTSRQQARASSTARQDASRNGQNPATPGQDLPHPQGQKSAVGHQEATGTGEETATQGENPATDNMISFPRAQSTGNAATPRERLAADNVLPFPRAQSEGDTATQREASTSAEIIPFPRTQNRESTARQDTSAQAHGGAPVAEILPTLPIRQEADTGGTGGDENPPKGEGGGSLGEKGWKERGFSHNLATDQARHPDVTKQYQKNPLLYRQLGNRTTLARAQAIMDSGLDQARTTLDQALGEAQAGRKLSPEMVPLAKMVGDALAEQGNLSEAERILSSVAVELTYAGQLGQSAVILRDASPSTRKMTLDRLIEELNQKLNPKNKEGKAKVTLPEQLAERYANSETDEARDQVLDEIFQNIAGQIPATLSEKFVALRYLNMLGNLKTQVRNVVGNAVMTGTRAVKDRVSSMLEAVYAHNHPDYEKRKSFGYDPALYRAASADFANVREAAMGEQAFDYSTRGMIQKIQEKRRIFKTPLLEKYRKLTDWAMEAGDEIFSKANYADALAQYMAANGVSAQQLSEGNVDPEFLERARNSAIQQAQKATFRDHNAVSDAIADIGFRNVKNNPFRQAVNTALQGVLPFRRTPANVGVRMVEYSPFGLVKTAIQIAKRSAGNADITGADIIDSLAEGLTGTGLFLLGVGLAACGGLSGKPDDDDEQAQLEHLTGTQDYAIVTPDGKSYTIDWLSPVAAPLIMGAEVYRLSSQEQGGENTIQNILEAGKAITNPLLETSMLSGLNDALDQVSYSDDKITDLFLNAALSYLTQGITSTLLSQVRQTIEDKRTTTYVDRSGASPLLPDAQRALGSISGKTPFLEYHQIPSIDAWGRQKDTRGPLENFVLPWYSSQKTTTPADVEIQRLLQEGQSGVVPGKTPQSVKVTYKENEEDKDEPSKSRYLSADEFVTYATTKGELSLRLVNEMVGSTFYQGLSDEEKANAIKLAYRYAGNVAAEEATDGKHVSDSYVSLAQDAQAQLGLSEAEYLLLYNHYGSSTNSEKVRKAYRAGMDPKDFLDFQTGKSAFDENKNGSYTIAELSYAIEQSGLSKEDQLLLWGIEKPDWAVKADQVKLDFSSVVQYKIVLARAAASLEKTNGKPPSLTKKQAVAALRAAGLPSAWYDLLGG